MREENQQLTNNEAESFIPYLILKVSYSVCIRLCLLVARQGFRVGVKSSMLLCIAESWNKLGYWRLDECSSDLDTDSFDLVRAVHAYLSCAYCLFAYACSCLILFSVCDNYTKSRYGELASDTGHGSWSYIELLFGVQNLRSIQTCIDYWLDPGRSWDTIKAIYHVKWILDFLILLFYHENELVMSDIIDVYYVSRLVNRRRMLEVKFVRYSRLYAVCIRSVKCSSS